METQEIFRQLNKLDPKLVKTLTKEYTRNGQKKQFSVKYITARTVMNMLDTIVGPANWRAEYQPLTSTVMCCTLFLRIDGEWIGKMDVGTPSDIEPEKGAVSDALKRAAVQWGIGRELYNEGTPTFEDDDPTQSPAKVGPQKPIRKTASKSELDDYLGPRNGHAGDEPVEDAHDPERESGFNAMDTGEYHPVNDTSRFDQAANTRLQAWLVGNFDIIKNAPKKDRNYKASGAILAGAKETKLIPEDGSWPELYAANVTVSQAFQGVAHHYEQVPA
jgi:hypothetical protein